MAGQTVAVLGAGGGGRASALHLGRLGLQVRLWEAPRFAAGLSDLAGTLQGEGIWEETIPLQCVTTDLAEAVTGADLIVACVQRGSHEMLGHELSSLMTDNQYLLLNPGSLGGALEIAQIFRAHGRALPAGIGETSTLAHCARPTPGGVRVSLEVRFVRFSAFPASNTAAMLALLQPLYQYFSAAQSVIETGLYNGNPIIHPPITLLNAGAIEGNQGTFRFYGDGMTPAVARVIAAVDRERQELGRAFGIDIVAEPDVCVRQGYADSAQYLECYRDSEVFSPLIAPNTLDHRYIHEDIGEGLITLLALAQVAGVSLPTVEAEVRLGEVISGIDFRSQMPQRLATLGLAGKSLEEMQQYVATGV